MKFRIVKNTYYCYDNTAAVTYYPQEKGLVNLISYLFTFLFFITIFYSITVSLRRNYEKDS